MTTFADMIENLAREEIVRALAGGGPIHVEVQSGGGINEPMEIWRPACGAKPGAAVSMPRAIKLLDSPAYRNRRCHACVRALQLRELQQCR